MRPIFTLPLLSVLLPVSTVLAKFDCIAVVDGMKFDLSYLQGSHSITTLEDTPPSIKNTTFTIDPCASLKILPSIPKNEQCGLGTRICAVISYTRPDNSAPHVEEVFPVAGDFANDHIDAIITRLSKSPAHADAGREGLRVELHGGNYLKRKQQAIIEFVCDKERTGWEGLDDGKTKPDDNTKVKRAEEGGEGGNGTDARSLTFQSYDDDTLRLSWRTKFACEAAADGGESSTGGKGFFTWFIIIVFLLVAAYLIFGSWLNYNKYGARGWDLLPHSDTIRDLPYLFRDFLRRVTNTFSGSGSRGGYSAV